MDVSVSAATDLISKTVAETAIKKNNFSVRKLTGNFSDRRRCPRSYKKSPVHSLHQETAPQLLALSRETATGCVLGISIQC